MFRPIILFLTRGRSHNIMMDNCQYQPVAVDEEPIEDHLHPLLIPLVKNILDSYVIPESFLAHSVISKIGAQLSVNDLLNFRLVCKSWNVEGTKRLQKKIKYLKVHPRTMYDFLRVYKQSSNQPSRSFSLYVDHTEHMMLFRSISETLSPCISSLRLSLSSQEIPNLPKILQNLSFYLQEFILLRIPEKHLPPPYRKYDVLEEDLHLPRLKSLSFRNMYPSQTFICNYDNFITDIINSAENLTHLEFQNWKSSLQQILRFMEISSSLESLVLCGATVKESEVGALKKKSLSRLKTLKITLGSNYRESTFTEFLETLQHSLETLDIFCDGPASTFPVSCALPQLKSLTFQSWKCQISLDNFIVKFPQLEQVKLLDFQFVSFTDYNYCVKSSITNNNNHNNNNSSSPSLVNTVYAKPCMDNDGLTDLNLASLITAFPNVKNFMSPFMTDSQLSLIFQYWKQLEMLDVQSCGKVTDFGITGMLTHPLQSKSKESGESSHTDRKKSSTLDLENGEVVSPVVSEDFCDICIFKGKSYGLEQIQRVNSYLGHLSELKCLFLRGSFNGLLTTESLHYGIFDLKNLTDLMLPDDANNWCFECIANKMKKLQRLYVDPNKSRVNPQDLLFLKNHIPNLLLVSSTSNTKRNKMV